MARKTFKTAKLIAAGLLVSVSWPAMAANVTQERLENADNDPANWITWGQNYGAQRYSRLDQINRDNVANLVPVFAVSLSDAISAEASGGMEVTPLVDDGQLFVNSGFGNMWSIDVSAGNRGMMTWTVDTLVDTTAELGFVWNRGRGPALWGNNVYQNLTDGRVVAVDQETGEILWDVQIARTTSGFNIEGGISEADLVAGEGFTATPLAAEGKILVGQSKGDWATRGWLAAINADTGEEEWRTYTVPAPGEPGHETWLDDHNAWRTGGASLWTTGSYDPDTRLTIWGTANPVPMFNPEFRPGDNLYTNSAVAFDIDTGAISWYFQYSPNEQFDYDENGVHFLYNATIDGQDRSIVGHFGRNGFFYQLDRVTGEFLNAGQFVPDLNWTAGIDPKTGKPVEYDPNAAIQEYAVRQLPDVDRQLLCPGAGGGPRWQPTAYNPVTQIAYQASHDTCGALGNTVVEPLGPLGGNPNGPGNIFLPQGGENNVLARTADNPGTYNEGVITAVNVTTNEVVARIVTPFENRAGVTDTAGGLLFTGHQDGRFVAYNDTTLELLYTFYVGARIQSPPITYAVDGRQYVAIIAAGGGNGPNAIRGIMETDAQLWVFALPL